MSRADEHATDTHPRPSRAVPNEGTRGGDPTDAGLLLLRVVVGLILVGYGLQKLFGWFGGGGVAGTGQFFASVGYEPGELFALASGVIDLGGGLMLISGAFMPLAGAAVLANMIGAFDVVRSQSEVTLYPTAGGAGYELMLAVAAAALILTGPGRYGLDHGRRIDSARWRWIGLALCLLGGVGGIVLRTL